MYKKLSSIILLTVFIAACGGGPGGSPVANSDEQSSYSIGAGGGAVSVLVKNSASFNPNIEHGRIISYRVTITGNGIAEPIVAEFDGQATGGRIDGVPTGEDREVKVEAVNPNSATIRQGEAAGVVVRGGETSSVEVGMESVPIFTNLADGNSINNTRLIFKVFAEPSGNIVVEEEKDAAQFALVDAATSLPEVMLNASTGLGSLAPVIQPLGQHKYIVKNLATNRFSAVTINLADGMKKKAAPFFTGSKSVDSLGRGKVGWGK